MSHASVLFHLGMGTVSYDPCKSATCYTKMQIPQSPVHHQVYISGSNPANSIHGALPAWKKCPEEVYHAEPLHRLYVSLCCSLDTSLARLAGALRYRTSSTAAQDNSDPQATSLSPAELKLSRTPGAAAQTKVISASGEHESAEAGQVVTGGGGGWIPAGADC